MRVVVTGEIRGGVVGFETLAGRGAGWWGEGVPEVGGGYEVEFEIGPVLKWGTQVRLTTERSARISQAGQRNRDHQPNQHGRQDAAVQLTAEVERELEPGLFSLRMANSVLTVEISGVPEEKLTAGTWIEITVPPTELTLYPYAV